MREMRKKYVLRKKILRLQYIANLSSAFSSVSEHQRKLPNRCKEGVTFLVLHICLGEYIGQFGNRGLVHCVDDKVVSL